MNVQWEDENLGESICNALKKEEVTYADIEGITGISIDSQYVVKLDWKDKTEQYVYNSGNDMCEILELQDFSTLADLKKFPYLRELYLNECIYRSGKGFFFDEEKSSRGISKISDAKEIQIFYIMGY